MDIHVTTTILQFFSILVLRLSELPCKTICGQEQRRTTLVTIFKNKKLQSWPTLITLLLASVSFSSFRCFPEQSVQKNLSSLY